MVEFEYVAVVKPQWPGAFTRDTVYDVLTPGERSHQTRAVPSGLVAILAAFVFAKYVFTSDSDNRKRAFEPFAAAVPVPGIAW